MTKDDESSSIGAHWPILITVCVAILGFFAVDVLTAFQFRGQISAEVMGIRETNKNIYATITSVERAINKDIHDLTARVQVMYDEMNKKMGEEREVRRANMEKERNIRRQDVEALGRQVTQLSQAIMDEMKRCRSDK